VALLLAVSPATGAKRVIPSLVLGACGGLWVLIARLRRREREGVPPQRAALAPVPGPVWAVGLGALALFASTGVWLYGQYTESIWRNPHGLFVAFFAVLMVRHRLREDPEPEPEASAWGFALLVPGCALAVLDAGIRSHYLSLLGGLLCLPGLALLLLGARRTRRLAFPLAYCLFLFPLPDGLGDPAGLPTLSAELGKQIVQAAGVPVVRIGAYLELASGNIIGVTQNCSGLSIFYSGCALATLCLAATRSAPRRLALLAAPYGLALLGNGVRVAVLLLLDQHAGLEWKYTTPLHGLLGTAVYLSVMAGIWLLSDRRALREALT
jgi:exosortase